MLCCPSCKCPPLKFRTFCSVNIFGVLDVEVSFVSGTVIMSSCVMCASYLNSFVAGAVVVDL